MVFIYTQCKYKGGWVDKERREGVDRERRRGGGRGIEKRVRGRRGEKRGSG